MFDGDQMKKTNVSEINITLIYLEYSGFNAQTSCILWTWTHMCSHTTCMESRTHKQINNRLVTGFPKQHTKVSCLCFAPSCLSAPLRKICVFAQWHFIWSGQTCSVRLSQLQSFTKCVIVFFLVPDCFSLSRTKAMWIFILICFLFFSGEFITEVQITQSKTY